MHTTQVNKTRFFHNGDYSGTITIVESGAEVHIPMEDLEELVAEKERRDVLQYIEELDLGRLDLRQHLQRIARYITDLDA
jgi:hypothetical protein